jgi:hypothetical protein
MMVKAGLWERAEGGYRIHDYLDFNPSRKEILKQRAKWSDKKKPKGDSPVDSPVDSKRDSTGESLVPVPVPQRNTSREEINREKATVGKGPPPKPGDAYRKKLIEITARYGHPMPPEAVKELDAFREAELASMERNES